MTTAVEEKLVERSVFVPGPLDTPCRVWRGVKPGNYVKIVVDGRGLMAHRVAYELWAGPIPEGLQIDHLCRNPSCINPDHLEPVTIGENIRRGHASRGTTKTPESKRTSQRRYYQRVRAAVEPKPNFQSTKTHCPQGHPYDEENTYVIPSRPNARYCWTCKRARRKAESTKRSQPHTSVGDARLAPHAKEHTK